MADATTNRLETASIFGRLKTGWSTTPIAWPGEGFDPAGASHIEPRLIRQDAFNAGYAASTKLIRHPGVLLITIRTPLKDSAGNPQGDGLAEGYADTLCALFRNVTFDRITFRAPTTRPLGDDGPWLVMQVTAPYYRDSSHTN